MVEAAGYVPVALSADDYVELLPARWHAVNAYGIKVNRRTYDGQELNPFRQQPSGVKEHKNRWEVHYDPYDVSRIWVRDHWNGGWVTVFWTQLHRVAAPFGEMAWDHARQPAARPPRPRKNSPTRSTACSAGPARDQVSAGSRTAADGTAASPPATKAAQPLARPAAAGRSAQPDSCEPAPAGDDRRSASSPR